MKIIINKTIGTANLQVEVEGKTEDEAFSQASGITTIPNKCSLCKSVNVELSTSKATTHDGKPLTYIKVRCLDCTATSTAGKYQDGTGIFWKAFEIYKKGSK